MNALIKKHTYYYNANLFDNILITAFHYNPSPSEFYVFYFMNLVVLVWGEGRRLCQATRQTPGTRNNRNTCPGPCFPCPDTNLRLAPQAALIPPQSCCLFPERSIPRLPESVLCHHPGLSSRSSLQENCPGLSPLSSSRPGVAQLSWKGPVANILGSAALTLLPAPHPISAPDDVQHAEAWQ